VHEFAFSRVKKQSQLYHTCTTVLYYTPQQKQQISFIFCRRQKTILMSTKIHSITRALYVLTVPSDIKPKGLLRLASVLDSIFIKSGPKFHCVQVYRVWSAHQFWCLSWHFSSLTFMGPCIITIFQYVSNKMQLHNIYLYLETALHVSDDTSTHHQERIQLHLQHLVFVTPSLLPAAISVRHYLIVKKVVVEWGMVQRTMLQRTNATTNSFINKSRMLQRT
jgi:hypothetical protein